MQLLQNGASYHHLHQSLVLTYSFSVALDDQTEASVVKSALIQHILIDPPKAIKVLCDQCVVDEEGIDEEERSIRNKFRSLVLRFLSEDAKGKVAEVLKARKYHDAVEGVLFEGLSKVSFLFEACVVFWS